MVLVNGKSLENEKVEQITLDGLLRVESFYYGRKRKPKSNQRIFSICR